MQNSEPNPGAKIKNKHVDDLIDHYWGSIQYISGLIKASELKAGLILTFYGILLNFVYQSISKFFVEIPGEPTLYILLGLWFCFTIISIFYSIRCFIPKMETGFDKNIFFFKDVITEFGDAREYAKTFYEISIDEDRLFPQLGQQIFVISKIATLKFKYVNLSLRFLGLGLVLMLGVVIFFAVFNLTNGQQI